MEGREEWSMELEVWGGEFYPRVMCGDVKTAELIDLKM